MKNARRLAAVAALSLVALARLARADADPAPERFAIVMNGEKIGFLHATRRGSDVEVDFQIDNNGRGPRLRERLTLGASGLPTAWRIEGKAEAGAPVQEEFSLRGGRAVWRSLGDAGEADASAPAVYVPKDASPWALGFATRAALAAPGGVLRTWPSGELRATRLRDVTLEGGAPLATTAYALAGLDLAPTYVLLDGARRLAAVLNVWLVVVDEAHASEAARLQRLAADLDRELLAAVARAATHRADGRPIYIRNARVFDSVAAHLSDPTTVVVYGNRVASVRPDAAPGEGAVVVDAEGGTLLPGLHDMHSHVWSWDGAYDLAAGVTSVRDPGNQNEVLLELTRRIDSGEILGPRITRSGFIEGRSPFSARDGFVVDSLDLALEKVRWYADHGYAAVKLYNSMRPDWVKPVAAEAHRLGLHVHGHVPAFMNAERAIRDGYDEITHVNQLMLGFVITAQEDTRTPFRFTALGERVGKLDLHGEPVQRVVRLMKERHVALDPTITAFASLLLGRPGKTTPTDAGWLDHVPAAVQRARRSASLDVKPEGYPAYEASWRKLLEMLALLDREGVRLLPGTDDVGGFALHGELETYAAAGIPNARVLQLATIECARHLGHDQERGSIAAGKLADLLLVDGDPLKEMSRIRRVRMVMKDGAIFFPEEIHRALGVKPFATRPRVTGLPPGEAPRG